MNARICQMTSAAVIVMLGYASSALAAPAVPSPNPCAMLERARQTHCYEARGFFWDGSQFVYAYRGQQPRFNEDRLYAEVLAEAGIVLRNGDKAWTRSEINIIATAVVKLSAKLGGIGGGARLRQLLGDKPLAFERYSHSPDYPGATAMKYRRVISFYDEMFTADRVLQEMHGTVIHELAHIIGDINTTPDHRWLKDVFPFLPNGLGLVAPKTYEAGNPEYFAEGMKLWVITDYPTAWKLDAQVQGAWLDEMLKG